MLSMSGRGVEGSSLDARKLQQSLHRRIRQTMEDLKRATASSAVSTKVRRERSDSEITKCSRRQLIAAGQHSPSRIRGRGGNTSITSLFQTSEISVTVPIPPRRAM